jgi:hypothetical protein
MRATSSLPVPDSPCTMTVASVFAERLMATCSASASARCRQAGECPTRSARSLDSASVVASSRVTRDACARARAPRRPSRAAGRAGTASVMKSCAPHFIASTAVSMVPNAVTTSTTTSGSCAFTCLTTSTPSIASILRSVTTTSAPFAWKAATPSRPLRKASTSWPAFFKRDGHALTHGVVVVDDQHSRHAGTIAERAPGWLSFLRRSS